MEQTVVKVCIFCNNSVSIALTNNQIQRIKSGEHVQNVAPYLSADEREILISGICGPCFDQTMPEPEEIELTDLMIPIGENNFHILPLPFDEGGIIKVLPEGIVGEYQTFGDDDDQHVVATINEVTFIAVYDLDKLQWKVSKAGIKTYADTWSQALAHGYYNHMEMRKEEPK